MNELKDHILKQIEATGPMPFADFMRLALYHPGIGYYTSEQTEIGKDGDFYTSSHVHPVFGALLGKQIIEMWELMGKPGDFHIIEPGAGRGYLASDMLNYLADKEIYQSLSYTIVELNPSLKARQQELLLSHTGRVRWVSAIAEVGLVEGVIVTNELFDALPVHAVMMQDGLKEIFVIEQDGMLEEVLLEPSTSQLADYLAESQITLQEGHRTECCLEARDWLRDAASCLRAGFIMTIDYGYPAREYYSEDRNCGTLMCYHKHQAVENPYNNIGQQDITAHVDFSALKRWGDTFDMQTVGFCRQNQFLISLGIDQMMMELYGDSPDYLGEIQKIKGLILPGTIGETHKVLIQQKGVDADKGELRGFTFKNKADRLTS